MTGTVREGGCHCGAIGYRITGEVRDVAHCHCEMCRRATGGPVTTWLTTDLDRFEVVRGTLRLWHSSRHGERGFCGDCGAQITFFDARRPTEIDVTVATLDRPDEVPAACHIWTRRQLSWLALDTRLPHYEEEREKGPASDD